MTTGVEQANSDAATPTADDEATNARKRTRCASKEVITKADRRQKNADVRAVRSANAKLKRTASFELWKMRIYVSGGCKRDCSIGTYTNAVSVHGTSGDEGMSVPYSPPMKRDETVNETESMWIVPRIALC